MGQDQSADLARSLGLAPHTMGTTKPGAVIPPTTAENNASTVPRLDAIQSFSAGWDIGAKDLKSVTGKVSKDSTDLAHQALKPIADEINKDIEDLTGVSPQMLLIGIGVVALMLLK